MDLHALRTLGVHFRDYKDALRRDKALEGVTSIINVVTSIFGLDGGRYWSLRGTKGGIFIAKDFESNPFVKVYVIPKAHLVGPYYSIEFDAQKTLIIDHPNYASGDITDDEFATIYNDRKPEQLAKRQPSN